MPDCPNGCGKLARWGWYEPGSIDRGHLWYFICVECWCGPLLLPAAQPVEEGRGIEIPPKSIDELAREQGLFLRPPPDYFSILSGLWESEEEAEAFRRAIDTSRREGPVEEGPARA